MNIKYTSFNNFHNSPALPLSIKKDNIVDWDDDAGYRHISIKITSYRAAKIRKHFCGISGCTCNSGGIVDNMIEP